MKVIIQFRIIDTFVFEPLLCSVLKAIGALEKLSKKSVTDYKIIASIIEDVFKKSINLTESRKRR